MAGVGSVYGEHSDGVCVPNEEVLQCVCTADDRVEAGERPGMLLCGVCEVDDCREYSCSDSDG